MPQQPSVGRIVHYHPTSKDEDQPNVALVAYVHNATCLNLYVVNKWGTATGYTSVCEGGPDKPGTWSWPPRV